MEYASSSEINPDFEKLVGQSVDLSGVVLREPDIRESTTHLYTRVDNETVLVITDNYTEFDYGDVISVAGELERPEVFTTDLGRTFNYPGYLLARNVSYLVIYGEVEKIGAGEGNYFLSTLLSFKRSFMQKVERLLPEPQAGLSEGLLLGVKRALGEDLETVFRRTGIIHIVVLSGYNVMLVVVFVMFILKRFMGRKLSTGFGLMAIISFAFLVGLSATVVRACIMASLLLLVSNTGRIYVVLRALVLAGLVMLLLNPYLLVFDVGFQLSFLATAGLIFLVPHLDKALKFFPDLFGSRQFLVATIAAQIAVLPLLLYQIGEFSVVAVVVNVLVLPMVPVAMLLTFITGMLAFVSEPLAMYLALPTNLSLQYIISVASRFAELPFASLVVPAFPFWLVIVSYCLIGLVVYRLLKQKKDYRELDGWTIIDESLWLKSHSTKPETPVYFR